MILPVLIAPNPILQQVATKVEKITPELLKLIDDMVETMYQDNGVGLAAPQVGVSKRVIVLDLDTDDDVERPEGFYPLKMINPEIIEVSEEKNIATEGCLSVPEQRIDVERPKEITMKYMDCEGVFHEIKTGGWLARAIQHEIDHINGKLLINYLSKMKRDISLRKLKKLKKRVA